MALKELRFDGQCSSHYGLLVTGTGTYDAPERDVEMICVPGRNGDLVRDNGRFQNIAVSYPVGIARDFPERAADLREWLLGGTGYRRLEDDYDPLHYRMALFAGPVSFDVAALCRAGQATLRFNCKPQRFLKSGERWTTVGGGYKIHNPTPFAAKPLIKIQMGPPVSVVDYATIPIHIGEYTFEVDPFYGEAVDLYIDCESQDIYFVGEITGIDQSKVRSMGAAAVYGLEDFPVLEPGDTAISWEVPDLNGKDCIAAIQMQPRWWTV